MRGPLHGIPIALKDNIHTTDLPTTGGALAFAGYMPPYEATLTKNLRDAGAIIIAKTGLTELANWVAGAPTPMPGNYNAVGGFAFNPYDPRPDPREATFDGRPALQTGGSSSGIGTAASFWAASVGTDTGGSVISPSNANMLVGIRPTIGRISRYGVIPITADHDTAGPMTRTVADAAILLGALESASPDPNDPATTTCTPPPGRDYTKFLQRRRAARARASASRARSTTTASRCRARSRPRGGLNAEQAKVMADAIAVLKQQGAIVVDPADVPSFVDEGPEEQLRRCGTSAPAPITPRARTRTARSTFKYGMKRDFNLWLKSLGPIGAGEDADRAARVEPRAREGGRDQVRPVAARHLRRDGSRGRSRALRRRSQEGSGCSAATNGIDGVLKAHQLDAILTPGGAGAGLAARAGYPIIVVPFGMVPNAPTPRVPGRVRREAGAVRRRLHGHGVQRAAADRARVRVRAGDEKARAAAVHAVTGRSGGSARSGGLVG